MNRQTFVRWWTSWVIRHPLRRPEMSDASGYARQVMARIAALSEPRADSVPRLVASFRAWCSRPRLALAMGAGVTVVLVSLAAVLQGPKVTLVRIDREVQTLADVGIVLDPFTVAPSEDAMEGELQLMDHLVLAEASSTDDETWIDQTLTTLNDVGESPEEADGSQVEEPWLNDLRELDDTDLSLG